jgi:hypothetical protein
MRPFVRIALCFVTCLPISTIFAQQPAASSIPNLIRYNGTLATPVSSATVGITFAIYKQQDGGASIWMESQNVTADANGQYTILLGSTTASGLPNDLFSQQEQRWLGVQVQGQAEQPRTLLVSVPYALKAQEAETLGGLPVSAFVKVAPAVGSDSAPQNEGIGGNSMRTLSGVESSGVGIDTVVNCTTAQNNYVPLFTSAAPPNIVICNSAIYQANGNIGIGTTSPVATLDVRGVNLTVSNPSFTPSNPELFQVENHKDVVDIYADRSQFSADTDLQFWTTQTQGGERQVMRLTSGGNVGIGTTTPTADFDVVGSIKFEGTGHKLIFPDGTEQTTAAGSGVTSWNGRTGAVVPQAGDYNFSQISGTLGNSQFSGTYSSAVTLSSGSNSFSGNGSGLTGIQFSQLSGTLGSSQLNGTYSDALTLSNTSNVYYGNGSHLTGISGGTLAETTAVANYTTSTDLSCPGGYQVVLASCNVGVNVVLNDKNTLLPPGSNGWANYLTPSVSNATGVHCNIGLGNQSQAQLRCAELQ